MPSSGNLLEQRKASPARLSSLTFRWPCIVKILIIKPTRCTNFSNLFLE